MSPRVAAPARRWAAWLERLGPLAGLAAVAAYFAVLRPETFPTIDNLQIILIQTAVVGTAAIGMTLVIVSGGIDLSVGSVIALVTVVVASCLSQGYPPLLAAGAGVIAGALCGLVNGGLVTGIRLTPFIVTLGTLGVFRGLAKGWADEQIVLASDIGWLEHVLRILGPDELWRLAAPGVWIMVLLAGLASLLMWYTRFGRHVFAIGSNEQTATLCGVRVARTRLLVYVLAGATAGLAGVLQFSYLTVGDPTTAMGLEPDVIAAVVIGGGSLAGGVGTISGTLTGAVIMTVIANGCTKLGLDNWVQEIITGAIIVLAVTIDQLRRHRLRLPRWLRRSSKPLAAPE
jgi:ribose/xylose/arabinose/galactoside ABC-type transport system permease subunit